MPTTIDIPGLGAVEFPDDLQGDALDKAVQKAHQQGVNEKLKAANETPLSEPTTYAEGAKKGAKEGATAGAVGYVKGVLSSPKDLVSGAISTIAHPIDTVTGMARTAAAVPNVVRSLAGGEMTPEAGAIANDPEAFGRGVGSAVGQTALVAGAPAIVAGAKGIPAGVQRALALAKEKGAPAVRIARIMATDPDVLGIIEPRIAHGAKAAGKLKEAIGKAREVAAAQDAATEASAAEAPAATVDPRERPVSSMPDRRAVDQGAPGGVSERRLAELRDKFTNEQKLSDPRYEDAVKSAAAPPPVTSINDAMKAAIARAREAEAPEGVQRGANAQMFQKAAKIENASLSGKEWQAGMDLVAQGVPAKEALRTILEQRLRSASPFANLPTTEEAAAVIAERNAQYAKAKAAKRAAQGRE